jgi:hypothetical protein
MPTTLTGLLLFVVMLLPGFAYVVGKERNGTERRQSPFRETVAIVTASITCELIVLVAFAIVRVRWPSATPDVGALVRHGGAYLRGNYAAVAAWGTGMLVLAVAIAYTATMSAVRRLGRWLTGPYPHDSTVSAWWILFDRWAGPRDAEAICILDDGSLIRGTVYSFNMSADDSPDRDLILTEPIRYRPPGGDEAHDYDVGAVCVAARRISTMFVNYSDAEGITSSEEEDQAGEASTAAALP